MLLYIKDLEGRFSSAHFFRQSFFKLQKDDALIRKKKCGFLKESAGGGFEETKAEDLLQNLPSEKFPLCQGRPVPLGCILHLVCLSGLGLRASSALKKAHSLQNAPSAECLFQYGKPLALCGSVNGGRIICHNWALAGVPIFEMPLLWALLLILFF
jgi:hypothetical protein